MIPTTASQNKKDEYEDKRENLRTAKTDLIIHLVCKFLPDEEVTAAVDVRASEVLGCTDTNTAKEQYIK